MSLQDSEPDTRLLQLQHLGKVFHTDAIETHALSNISLDIARGDFIAITGPSGCGKSTLMSILGLLDAPTSGEYWFGARNVAQLAPSERARIRNSSVGFIFQSFNLIHDLTVAENVELPLTYRHGLSRQQREQRVRARLDEVGMLHRIDHYPGQLSGGQQQRVAVARALVGEPALLLADEPTGNLDTLNGEAVMRLLETLHARGTTLCMVTHDLAFARRAQRVVHMLDGGIVDEDTFKQRRHEFEPPTHALGAG
jgi:putative ABC transport system ATP-binding protein